MSRTDAERAAIVKRAIKLRNEIQQTFIDCTSWNENVRKPFEEPIDCDEDGQLRRILDGLNAMLKQEAATGGTGPLPPIVSPEDRAAMEQELGIKPAH